MRLIRDNFPDSVSKGLDGVQANHSPGWNKQVAKQLWTITDSGQYPESFDPWNDDQQASVYYERHLPALEGSLPPVAPTTTSTAPNSSRRSSVRSRAANVAFGSNGKSLTT